MKLINAILLIVMLSAMYNLTGAMHCTLERGVDFGSKGLDNVQTLSDGHYVSFGRLDVDLFAIENSNLRFIQKCYSTGFYRASRMYGADTLLAITNNGRLDVYAYNPPLELNLLRSYSLESEDSLAIFSEEQFLGDGFVLVGAYVNSDNLDTCYCQSIYALNGIETPILVSRVYCNYLNRFTRIEHINQEYYYFGYDGSMYASPNLTNQPQLVTCPDLSGHTYKYSKVLQGSLYVISTDDSSNVWLSKLENVDEGCIDTAWMLNLGIMQTASITDITNGYVHIIGSLIFDFSKIIQFSFSDSLQWQLLHSRSFPIDDYQLYPFNNGYVLFGYEHVRLLADTLLTQTTLLAGNNYWWTKQIFLNRYMLLSSYYGGGFKLYDLETGQFLDYLPSGNYSNHMMRYGEDKLIFVGSQVEVVTLGENGVSDYLSFPNTDNVLCGSVYNDKIVIVGYLDNLLSLTLYRIMGTTVEQLNNIALDYGIEAIQFYDASHFAIIENTGFYSFTLKLYKIEQNNSISLLASYPSTGFTLYVCNNILTAETEDGLVLDVSNPDNPIEVTHDIRWNYTDMSFNGEHNYMECPSNIAYIFDDNFQYTGYMQNLTPFFLSGNRVLIPGLTCAVIVTLDDITANPPEESIAIPGQDMFLSNSPNPFSSNTDISFSLSKSSHVNLTIYNLKGQKVTQLKDNKMVKGDYKLTWDGTDSNHKNVSSGIYFARLDTGKTTSTCKMILMK